jgi:hypothetical protein
LLRPLRFLRLPRSMRLHRYLRPGKSSLSSDESISSLNLIIYDFIFMFKNICLDSVWSGKLGCPVQSGQKKICPVRLSPKMSGWILASFLSEAVEASQCYFCENRLIKLKCPNLLNMLLTFF